MSSGGINASQLPAGGVPAAVGSQRPAAQQQSQVPTAGTDAGSVDASGGMYVPDDVAHTAGVATGVAANAQYHQTAAAQAREALAGMDPQTLPQTSAAAGGTDAAAAPAGPAAWNSDWEQKFRDVGAGPDVIQQLGLTGGMGYDDAQLQELLDKVKTEVDTQLAKFAHDHPEAYKTLAAVVDLGKDANVGMPQASDKAALAQLATAVNSGQIKDEDLEMLTESVGKSTFDTMVKPFLAYGIVPGYGALSLPFAAMNDWKDPASGYKLFGDPTVTAFSVMGILGGVFTVANNVRGIGLLGKGMSAIAKGGTAGKIAAASGVHALSGFEKFKSFLPFTKAGRTISAIGLFDKRIDQQLKHFQAGTAEHLAAQVMKNAWAEGKIGVQVIPASKPTMMGFQPNWRGIFWKRNADMGQILPDNVAKPSMTQQGFPTKVDRPTLMLDGRVDDPTAPAHFISYALDFAEGKQRTELFSKIFGKADAGGKIPEAQLKIAREKLLGGGTNALGLAKANTWEKITGYVRPGAGHDARWAARNVTEGTEGVKHGTQRIPNWIRKGVILPAAGLGAGYLVVGKPIVDQLNAAKEQQAAALEEQKQAEALANDPAAQMQAALEEFAALPKDQQRQFLQENGAKLQQAAQTPNLTAEQQQELQTAVARLDLFQQVAAGADPATLAAQAAAAADTGVGAATGGGGGQAAAAASPAPQQGQQAAGAASGGTPVGNGYTAEGLGLAS